MARKPTTPRSARPAAPRGAEMAASPMRELGAPEGHRPSHIVLFRERPAQAPQAVLAKHLAGIKPGRSAFGVTALAALGGTVPLGQHYQDLGVVAMDLGRREADALRQDSASVLAVLPNEWRSLPRPVGADGRPLTRPAEAIGPWQPFETVGNAHPWDERGGGPQPWDERGGPSQPFSNSALIEYLRGSRDSIDALLRRLGAADGPVPHFPPVPHSPYDPRLGDIPAPESGVAEMASQAGMTYGLRMIGLHKTAATGAGIKVAVLDTGLDLAHPEFQARVAAAPGNFKSFSPGAATAQDDHGHGTHVCGTIVGGVRPGPRFGIAPGAELLVGKVLGVDGGYDSDIIAGIQWAVSSRARVINMSLGSTRTLGEPCADAYEAIASRLMDRPEGPLIVCAAGNESDRPWQVAPVGNPAACPSFMAAAALDRRARVAPFSCGGVDNIGEVNIAAPGVDIYSTRLGGGYTTMSGTSMAAPHVTGVAALLLEAMLAKGQPVTPSQLWDRVLEIARPLPMPARDCGRGLASCV